MACRRSRSVTRRSKSGTRRTSLFAGSMRATTAFAVGVHDDGTTVLMLLRAQGIARYTGIEVEVEWAAVWTIRDGKLLRAQGYLNRAEALEAAGLPT